MVQILAGINTALLAVISLSILDLRSRVVRLENNYFRTGGGAKHEK